MGWKIEDIRWERELQVKIVKEPNELESVFLIIQYETDRK